MLTEFRRNTYVEVYGVPRSFEGTIGLRADCIRPLSDFNGITKHLLECLSCHLLRTRGPPPSEPIVSITASDVKDVEFSSPHAMEMSMMSDIQREVWHVKEPC